MAKSGILKDYILFEDEDLAVINKLPFVPSLPERGKVTAVSILERAKELWPDAVLGHRLDRETSGALIIAKNTNAYRHIAIQFEKRLVTKIYHAIVEGRIVFENLVVDLPIDAEKLDKIHISHKTGKAAITTFNTLQLFKNYTLLECAPVTGRLHQIRVHLASQNARIAGDLMYGGQTPHLSAIKKKFNGEESILIKRFALHARTLSFQNMEDKKITVEAPYSKDLQVFIKMLNKYDSFQ